jgi:hypothetical protein
MIRKTLIQKKLAIRENAYHFAILPTTDGGVLLAGKTSSFSELRSSNLALLEMLE